MLEHLYFPHDISTFGPKIDFLFELIFWIVMVVWVAGDDRDGRRS